MGNTASAKQRRPSNENDAHLSESQKRRFENRLITNNDGIIKFGRERRVTDLGSSRFNDNPVTVSDDFNESDDIRIPTVFRWSGEAKEVCVSGTFNKWRTRIPLVRSKKNFCVIIDLPKGEYQYKFAVDGQWKIDESKPHATNNFGELNNFVEVLHSGSDFFDDSTFSGNETPPGSYGQQIPENMKAALEMAESHRPTGGSITDPAGPPTLPGQLLSPILNSDTDIQNDPNLLPQPHHVMVNHLYALSITQGVIVLSTITRYRQKFVATVMYKPI